MSDAMTKEEAAQFEEMRRADAAFEAQQTEEAPPPQPPQTPQEPQQPPQEQPEPDLPDEPPDSAGRVDKRALDQARRTIRELREAQQREAAEHAAALARVDERFRLVQGAVEQYNANQRAPETQPQPPDFNTDPAGYMQHRFATLEQRQQAWEQQQAADRAARQQQQELNELQAWGIRQEQAFAETQPDYMQATAYLRGARTRMLQAMGETDPAKIEQQVLMDVAAMAVRARAMGLNFGKSLYDLAKAHGYQPGAATDVQHAGNGQGNGADNGARPGASAAERLARGTDMATTVGSIGGAPRGEPAAAHIAAMTEDEFARYYATVQKQGPAALRALLGA